MKNLSYLRTKQKQTKRILCNNTHHIEQVLLGVRVAGVRVERRLVARGGVPPAAQVVRHQVDEVQRPGEENRA